MSRLKDHRPGLGMASRLLVCLLVCFATPALAQTPGFSGDININSTINAIQTADIFGSSAPDIVVGTDSFPASTSTYPQSVVVIENQGPFADATVSATPLNFEPSGIEIADFDGDGNNDILAYRWGHLFGEVAILLNQGSAAAGFALSYHPFFVNSFPFPDGQPIQIIDYDSDGDLDIVADLKILPNLGNGSFGPEISIAVPAPGSAPRAEWGDYDGDGLAEVVDLTGVGTSAFGVSRWEYLPTTSSLVFRSWTPLTPFGMTLAAVPFITADFDRDGNDDLLVSFEDPASSNTIHRVLLGDAGSPLSAALTIPDSSNQHTYGRPQGLDLDSDGSGELVFFDLSPISSFPPPPPSMATPPLNFDGSGFTPSPTTFPAIQGPYCATDYNGDGWVDLIQSFPTIPGRVFVNFGGPTPVRSLHLLSGNLSETLEDGAQTSAPIVVEVRDETNSPVPNQELTLLNFPAGAGITGTSTTFTDAQGRISFSIVAPDPGFDFSVELATVGFFNSTRLTFSYTRQVPYTLEFVPDALPFVTADRNEMVEVLITDAVSLLPAAGVALEVTTTPGVNLTSSATPTTDMNGRVRIEFVPTTAQENVEIEIQVAGDPSLTTSLPFPVRRLQSFYSAAASFVILSYDHENFGVPLLIAVEPPASPALAESTPFGDVFTSLLNPQPGLLLLDGTVNPAFQSPFSMLFDIPPSAAGTSLVVQTYAIDNAYAFPLNIVISNATYLTF